jgi:hypothetical protein
MHKPRIIVTGFVGLYPYGGVVWDYLQYAAGFAELGWDVLYLEDTGLWPVYQGEFDSSLNVGHVASAMDLFGLADRWAYRDAVSGKCFGLSEQQLKEYCRSADVFLNISCSAMLRDEYAAIPVRVLLDTDPMFTQIQYLSDVSLTGGQTGIRSLVQNHTHRFTFGGNIGEASCRVPTLDLEWFPTRQPVVLSRWPVSDAPEAGSHGYSTVMNWSVFDSMNYEGEQWGQKDIEFLRFLRLPQRLPRVPLGVAVSLAPESTFPAEQVREAGWIVLDAARYVADARSYQDFIAGSRGEFSVAKETYVKANTGWFSCRSTCYLAAGRPVITQDTSWSRLLPTGRGLLAFHDEESAIDALQQVEADPKVHAKAARAVAEEFFDSGRVLREMLDRIGW